MIYKCEALLKGEGKGKGQKAIYIDRVCERLHHDEKYFLLTAHVFHDNEPPHLLAGRWSMNAGQRFPHLVLRPDLSFASSFIECYSTDNHLHTFRTFTHTTLI